MYVCTWSHQYNNQISADFWHKTLFLILWDIMDKTKNCIYWRQTFIQRSKPANNFQMLCSSKSTADLLDLSNDMYIKQKHSEVKVNNNNKKKGIFSWFLNVSLEIANFLISCWLTRTAIFYIMSFSTFSHTEFLK